MRLSSHPTSKIQELLPYIYSLYNILPRKKLGFAGGLPLINAAYLINQERRKSPLEISNYELFNPNLYRGWGRDTSDWDFFPRSLSLKEYRNPYLVFKRFFKFKKLDDWKSALQEILDYALARDSQFEAGANIDCLSIYLYLTKLIEAAHLIDVREIYHIGGMIKDRMKEK